MTAETDFLLTVEGLTVSFDGFRAVDDLSLYLSRNEIRVIIGPNGAGKTTLLDLICGRTRASSGSITFNGRNITHLREYDIVRAGIGRKFQTPSIYEDLTVFENLEISFPPRSFGIRRPRLPPRRRSPGPYRGGRAHHFPRRSAGPVRRTSQSWSEAVAGDRHAADPGPGSDDAGRTRCRHERQ